MDTLIIIRLNAYSVTLSVKFVNINLICVPNVTQIILGTCKIANVFVLMVIMKITSQSARFAMRIVKYVIKMNVLTVNPHKGN